jgi:hypothetical protein
MARTSKPESRRQRGAVIDVERKGATKELNDQG